MKIKPLLSTALAVLLIASLDVELAAAQDLHPSRRLSPVGIAKTHIGDAYVKVNYGRPYMRDREIFGMNTADKTFLVPFGEIWRTGANESTEITLTEPLMVDGNRLDDGTYAIFTEPGADEWIIHFSPQLGLDGTGSFDPATGTVTPVYDTAQDVLVIEVPTGTTAEEVDQFTIDFEARGGGADLVMRWERTEVRIPLRPASS